MGPDDAGFGRARGGSCVIVTVSLARMFLVVLLLLTPVVPAEAVVNTGEISYVFLARGEGHFEPRRVWTGTSDGDQVTVLKGLAEGDTVVSSASFLIDSESRLKAAIAGLSAPDTVGAPAGAAHRH